MKYFRHSSLRQGFICNFVVLLLIVLSQNLFAQQKDELDQLTAYSLNLMLDSLSSNFYSPECLDTNYYLFYDDYCRTTIIDKINRPLCGILKEKKGKLWLGDFQYVEKFDQWSWYYTKHIYPKESKYIMVILKPVYELESDTLVISFTTASYYWGKPFAQKKSKKRWMLGISDIGVFRFIYSSKQKKWILVAVKMSGI